MTVVRLNRSRYSPKDATGAKLHGGRWNSPGEVEVPEALISRWTFTGEAALAKIESPVLSREYGVAWFRRTMPRSSQEATLLRPLPAEIQEYVQQLKMEPTVPVQAVPSVIISREMNYLISPVHPQFGRLLWGESQPFRFDASLIASAE